MKKNEDQAAKKKPKTSAAQIRVQKGAYAVRTLTWCRANHEPMQILPSSTFHQQWSQPSRIPLIS